MRVQSLFNFQYHPSLENLADYLSKSHLGSHHLKVWPFYAHIPNSPRHLRRVAKPSVRRRCVDKVSGTYTHKYPLPSLRFVTRGTHYTPAAMNNRRSSNPICTPVSKWHKHATGIAHGHTFHLRAKMQAHNLLSSSLPWIIQLQARTFAQTLWHHTSVQFGRIFPKMGIRMLFW
jgi:hypothetical protein